MQNTENMAFISARGWIVDFHRMFGISVPEMLASRDYGGMWALNTRLWDYMR